jgi:hypothetical protein
VSGAIEHDFQDAGAFGIDGHGRPQDVVGIELQLHLAARKPFHLEAASSVRLAARIDVLATLESD